MTPLPSDPVVTCTWLVEHLDVSDVQAVDVRGVVASNMIEPGVQVAKYRGCHEDYLADHIPGAVYVDWTRDIVNSADPIPAQLASPDVFAEAMASRGIGDETLVVAYDQTGGQFATRLWWALMAYGHQRVVVLDGGYSRWCAEGRECQPGPVERPRATFSAQIQPAWRKTAEEVRDLLGAEAEQIVDARGADQYAAAVRRGPRGGHIPGAIHLAREAFFSQPDGFQPLEEIRQVVNRAGLSPDRPVTAYCNGGVAATVILFHLYRLGFPTLANYDGSWNEWSGRLDLPVATPPAD